MDHVNNIIVLRCSHCGTLALSPQYVCENCESTNFVDSSIIGRGKVYSHTTIHVASDNFRDQVPYRIVLVDLNTRLRITARLVQDTKRQIDIGEDLIFDRVDEHGYWFRTASK